VVVAGDTLWDLAERYLGNPFRWPLIYDVNQDLVADPDLIEIGWSLTIPGLAGDPAEIQGINVVPEDRPPSDPAVVPVTVPSAPAAGSERRPGPERTIFFPSGLRSETSRTGVAGAGPGSGASAAGTREYAVPRGLVYGAEWIEPAGVGWSYEGTLSRILDESGLEGQAESVGKGTLVSISPVPGTVMRPGDLLQAFRLQWSDRKLGTSYKPSGVLVVTDVAGEAISARVASQFERVRLGDLVRQAPEYDPDPYVLPNPVQSEVTAVILGFPDEKPFYGLGASVFLDLGAGTEVSIGDMFGAHMATPGPGPGLETTRLQVVRVYGSRATARVVGISDPGLRIGDSVRLVAKMD
jgi:hypothetical protein